MNRSASTLPVVLVLMGLLGCHANDEGGASPTPAQEVAATPMYYPFDATPLPGFEAAELPAVEEALVEPGATSPPQGGNESAPGAEVSAGGSNATGGASNPAGATNEQGAAGASGEVSAAAASWSPSPEEMEQALADYGTWQTVPAYGKVWVPSGMAKDWRPYQLGHWVNTPRGWLWEAAEPWGWLPYHYGYWVFVPGVGWAWLPGRVWVPAQVAWRANDTYVAWAPMPPGGIAVAAIRPAAWIVVPVARFLDLTPYRYRLPPPRVRVVVPGLPILARTFAVSRTTVYHVGPTITVVRRWVPVVPPPVSVHVWRARVPVRYATHFRRGRARGWYRPPGPPPGRGVHVRTGNPRRGTEVNIERKPLRGRSVEVEHHNRRRSVEVEVDHRGRHRKVEVERRGLRRDVEIERRGRRVRVDVHP